MAPGRAISQTIGIKSFLKRVSVSNWRPLHTTSPQLSNPQDPARSDQPKQGDLQRGKAPKNDDESRSLPFKSKTVSQADAELRERLEQMSGEGGASGIEYEDGKPNAMKRGVRNNMFRLI